MEAVVTADIVQQIHTMVEITKRSAKQSTEVLVSTDAYDYVTFGFRQKPQTSSESSFEMVSPSSGMQDSTTLETTTPTTTPSKMDEIETDSFEQVDNKDVDLQSISSTETEPTTIVENVPVDQQASKTIIQQEEVQTPTATVKSQVAVDQVIETEQQQSLIKEEVSIEQPESRPPSDFEMVAPTAEIESEFVEVSKDDGQIVEQQPQSVQPTKIIVEVNVGAEDPSSMTSSLSDAGQPPKFRLGLAPSTLRCGRSAQLKCIVTGLPTPEVSWFVDGDQVISGA